MSAQTKQRQQDYRRRLKRRLERQPVDAAYSDLLRVARLNVLLETQPYDHDLAVLAEWLARAQWPSNEGHSVKVWPPLSMDASSSLRQAAPPRRLKPVAPPANPSNLTRY